MRLPRPIRQRIKLLRRWTVYGILRAVYGLMQPLPYQLLRVIGVAAGHLAYLFLARERAIIHDNLRRAFPARSAAFRERVARGVFLHQARQAIAILEFHRTGGAPRACRVPMDVDWHAVGDFLLREGSVAAGAHIGSWELLGIGISRAWPGRLAVYARRLYFAPYNRWITQLRERFGMKVFYVEDSPRRALRHLKNGNTLGILPDQDLPRMPGIFEPFFGHDAWTPIGPAVIALAAGVPVCGICLVWDHDAWRMVLGGPVRAPKTGNRDEDVRILTQTLTRFLEDVITRYPEQWVWFHRRWRTTPEEVARRRGP